MFDGQFQMFSAASRRGFLRNASLAVGAALVAESQRVDARQPMVAEVPTSAVSAIDRERIRALAAFTALTFDTPNPVPYGCEIFNTVTGKSLMRATNAVGPEHDPSAHAEVHTIRLACKQLQTSWLRGYTLYTTCEPCAMCMACSLWCGLDRVVYGATVGDAARFGHQIQIPAAEIVKRSDMHCVVDGPVEHAVCLALFTDPRMRAVFKRWKEK